MRSQACCSVVRALCCSLPLLLAVPASAQRPLQQPRPFDDLVRTDPRLLPSDAVEPLEHGAPGLAPKVSRAWDLFQIGETGEWQAYYNRSNGRVEMVEGAGIPWLPGTGNQLTRSDLSRLWAVSLADTAKIRLSTLERIARAFLPRVQALLGVDPATLVLNLGRSGQPTEGVWFVDFDVVAGGLPIDGARVVFRVNHGNLVQFGTEGLPTAGATRSKPTLSRQRALEVVTEATGGLDDEILDPGSLHLLVSEEEGKGRGLLTAWQFLLRRPGVIGTWRARVDAATGALLEFADVNDYGQVQGGVYLIAPSVAPEAERPLPDVDVTTAFSGTCADFTGFYSGTGGSSSLKGCLIKIVDTCGSINQGADPTGLIDFGMSAGTDCATPGHGGAGNTHASRTQSYHLSRLREVGRSWLPSNGWLAGILTTNVNLTQTCNAYWNGVSLNLFRSGGGCANSGELSSISIHEYGHGLDANDGSGSSPDLGTSESYGDFTAALQLHDSCVGRGFLGSNCSGYGDPCTSCTGVRDIDWTQHASGVPHTVANFTQLRCPSGGGGAGPCGKEGHCESYVPSEALWDLANLDLPSPGSPAAWLVVDRLWYLSRSTATRAFSCTPGTTFTSNGCNTGSLWKTFRAVDDDDGNLANGTPHSCALFAAFNRHGIACTTDAGASTCFPGCTAPANPVLTVTTDPSGHLEIDWPSQGAGVVFDVFHSVAGCKSAFTKATNDTSSTSVSVAGASGVTQAYQVVAQPVGNESCGAASNCIEVTPCTVTTLLHEAFGTGAAGWTLGTDWRDQTCSLSGVLHFGGATCGASYGNSRFSQALSPAITVPAGTVGAKLTLSHRYQFETGFDGGAILFSLDGGSPIFLPASTILSGASYNGTLSNSCPPAGTAGASVFTGTQSTFVSTVVNLDAACNIASGGLLTSCGGHTIRVDFAGISDCTVTAPGWFLDDVAVAACVP
ncbi:MAG TPA: hypothetical protein VF173_07705 [Thermoanaerobaculia bacterium]|nr:hypothetical protein [Thermoanaerobaculia bacterium]